MPQRTMKNGTPSRNGSGLHVDDRACLLAPPECGEKQPWFGQLDLGVEFLSILAAPERLSLLILLSEAPRSVNELADTLEIEVSLLSYHLSVLYRYGIVRYEKQSRKHVYFLHPAIAIEIMDGSIRIEARLISNGVLGVSLPLIDPQAEESTNWRSRRHVKPRRGRAKKYVIKSDWRARLA